MCIKTRGLAYPLQLLTLTSENASRLELVHPLPKPTQTPRTNTTIASEDASRLGQPILYKTYTNPKLHLHKPFKVNAIIGQIGLQAFTHYLTIIKGNLNLHLPTH